MTHALPFTKMQALGNDFVLIEERHLTAPLQATHIRWISDRRQGIGCDQVIVIKDHSQADAALSFYNADGSVAMACGNGTRCVAKFLEKDSGILQTPSFLSQFWRKNTNIATTLKKPTFNGFFPLPEPFLQGYAVDIGNPHVVVFTDQLNDSALETLASTLHSLKGVNIELAQIISSTTLKVKVWERGVGMTPACGSGACAVGILSLKLGLIQKPPVVIEMDGGTLEVAWLEGTPPLLTGPADYCFKGTVDLP